MTFGTTNYPVFVEFTKKSLNHRVPVSISISSINYVEPDGTNGCFICVGNYCMNIENNYQEAIAKINAKIPKPAKWPNSNSMSSNSIKEL